MPDAKRDEDADKEVLLAEYQATQDAYLHSDNFSWHVGSVLVAGTFVLWGFMLQDNDPSPILYAVGTLFFLLLMSAWALYVGRNRQTYLWKLHRVQEIETELHMKQHRRFGCEGSRQPVYRLYGPKGHWLDRAIYFLACAGTIQIAAAKCAIHGLECAAGCSHYPGRGALLVAARPWCAMLVPALLGLLIVMVLLAIPVVVLTWLWAMDCRREDRQKALDEPVPKRHGGIGPP